MLRSWCWRRRITDVCFQFDVDTKLQTHDKKDRTVWQGRCALIGPRNVTYGVGATRPNTKSDASDRFRPPQSQSDTDRRQGGSVPTTTTGKIVICARHRGGNPFWRVTRRKYSRAVRSVPYSMRRKMSPAQISDRPSECACMHSVHHEGMPTREMASIVAMWPLRLQYEAMDSSGAIISPFLYSLPDFDCLHMNTNLRCSPGHDTSLLFDETSILKTSHPYTVQTDVRDPSHGRLDVSRRDLRQ